MTTTANAQAGETVYSILNRALKATVVIVQQPLTADEAEKVARVVETVRDEYLALAGQARQAIDQVTSEVKDPSIRQGIYDLYFGSGDLATVFPNGKFSQEERFENLLNKIRENTGKADDLASIEKQMRMISGNLVVVKKHLTNVIEGKAQIPFDYFPIQFNRDQCKWNFLPIAPGHNMLRELNEEGRSKKLSSSEYRDLMVVALPFTRETLAAFVDPVHGALEIECKEARWPLFRPSSEVRYDGARHKLVLTKGEDRYGQVIPSAVDVVSELRSGLLKK